MSERRWALGVGSSPGSITLAPHPKQVRRRFLEEGCSFKPDYAAALNDLAWILATETDLKIHNVPEAIRLARRACELTHDADPMYLDTLGVAFSEAGRFPDAIQTTEKAVAAASSSGRVELGRQIQSHLNLYREGRPYR